VRKFFFIVILVLTDIVSINASDLITGYFNYYYTHEFNLGNNDKHSFGYEFLFYDRGEYNGREYFCHALGLNFEPDMNFGIVKLNSYYNLFFDFPRYFKIYMNNMYIHRLLFGLGTNISYDFQNKIFGIGPQITMKILFFAFGNFNLTYRYNININNKNANEIELTIGVLDILFSVFLNKLSV
jgi:hypothetical protein